MRPYRPLEFRPRSPSPLLGQTFDEILGVSPAMGDMIRLVVHGFSGFLGGYFGSKEKGILSALGWSFAFINGLGAAMDAASLVKRAIGTHPPPAPQQEE